VRDGKTSWRKGKGEGRSKLGQLEKEEAKKNGGGTHIKTQRAALEKRRETKSNRKERGS